MTVSLDINICISFVRSHRFKLLFQNVYTMFSVREIKHTHQKLTHTKKTHQITSLNSMLFTLKRCGSDVMDSKIALHVPMWLKFWLFRRMNAFFPLFGRFCFRLAQQVFFFTLGFFLCPFRFYLIYSVYGRRRCIHTCENVKPPINWLRVISLLRSYSASSQQWIWCCCYWQFERVCFQEIYSVARK